MDQAELDEVKAATKAGVQAALADKQTYQAAFAAFSDFASEKAQQESGKWVIGWIKWSARKIATVAVILGVLYYTGGIPAVLAWIKTK